jgi:hypothetical protein
MHIEPVAVVVASGSIGLNVSSIGAAGWERQAVASATASVEPHAPTAKRRRTEDPKIRRKSVTLRAAGPRVARSTEPPIHKDKHPLLFGVFVFADRWLRRTPALRAGVLQPLNPGRRSVWGLYATSFGKRQDGNMTFRRGAASGHVAVFRRFPSDLRIFDVGRGLVQLDREHRTY